MQVLQQNAEYDALQWSSAVLQHYDRERSTIASAAEQATRASAERAGIGQWLSGLVLREGKVRRHVQGHSNTSVIQWKHAHHFILQYSSTKPQIYAVVHVRSIGIP